MLITDCSALTWLFKSQPLTPKYHRWALRSMEQDITLKWRPGTQHQLPDAMSWSPNKSNAIEVFDDSFPGDGSLPNVYKGPRGSVLDSVHLETLGVEDVDGTSTQSLAVLVAVAFTPADLSEADAQQAKLAIAPELPVVVMLDCGGVPTRSTRRTVQHLASQMGRICIAGIVDSSYHTRPALTGEANFLPSFLRL